MDLMAAQIALVDRWTTAETLTQIAREFPELRNAVAAHPNWPASPPPLRSLPTPPRPPVPSPSLQTPPPPQPPQPSDYRQQPRTSRSDASTRQSGSGSGRLPAQPAPAPKSRVGLVVGLVAIVVIVAVALVAAMVVLPTYRNQAGESVAVTGIERAEESGEEDLGPRIPIIREEPKGWSAPVKMTVSKDVYFSDVVDTGTSDIVVVGSRDNLQAVELGSTTILWTVTGYYYRATLDNGTGLVSTENVHFPDEAKGVEYLLIDLLTGALTPISAAIGDESIYHVWNGVIITQSVSRICARRMENIGHCQWQAAVMEDFNFARFQNIPTVFGDGRWINTKDGVFDLETGRQASFGSDVFAGEYDGDELDDSKDVMYTGPSDGVVRVSKNKKGDQVIQPWDTQLDRPKADPLTANGFFLFECLSADHFLIMLESSGSSLVLGAYSWQTGKQVWKSSLKLRDGIPYFWVYENVLHIWIEGHISVKYPDRPRDAILAIQTGESLWLGNKRLSVEKAAEVLYAVNGEYGYDDFDDKGAKLYAFDSAAESLPALWSVAAPGKGVGYYFMAYHIFALSCATGELWVLQR